MYTPDDLDLSAAVSDDDTLELCLEASPDVRTGLLRVRAFRGYASASHALNAALDTSEASIVILPHQDVYLPVGFVSNLLYWINELHAMDPDWAVVGCIGMDGVGRVHGETWSSGMGRLVGVPSRGIAEVDTVDEMILIVRKESGARFDGDLPGFHLYGTDIVTSARGRGNRSYVVPLPVIHHSRPLVKLGSDYWAAYLHLRRRWKDQLPIATMFGGIHRSLLPLLRIDLDYRWRNRGRSTRPARTGDPAQIATKLGYDSGRESP